jgi:hypothetical protein
MSPSWIGPYLTTPADSWLAERSAVTWCPHCSAERATYTSRRQLRCLVCRRRLPAHSAPRR